MAICHHSNCRCEVPNDGEFCSEGCRDLALEQPCICGHAHCAGVMNPEVDKAAL